MKNLFCIVIALCCSNISFAQQWTTQEFESANTAKNISVLTEQEKEVVRYINLARLYPKKFAHIEIVNTHSDLEITNNQYLKSLVYTLKRMKPADALYFNESMYQLAKCFAEESGQAGAVGHHRKTCKKGYDAECCSYGYDTGKEVVIQLLVDEDVPNLGHRNICLDKSMEQVGLSIQAHLKYDHCCVLDFKRKAISNDEYNKKSSVSFFDKVTNVFK
ncbi:MAG: CAP domain-containing protein [Bacteroidota bacterium]